MAGVADSIAGGVELARATIASGAARAKLDAFVAVTGALAGDAVAVTAATTPAASNGDAE